MLIQFVVENYMSIKNKAFLSLEPSTDNEHIENICVNGKNKALNTISIYGANASGKSNLFRALTVSLNMIRNATNIQINNKLPVVPFKFDETSRTNPSFFEFTFVAEDGKKYIYGFSATKEKIVEEYLYFFNSSKASKIYEISMDAPPSFSQKYRRKLEKAYEMNIPNKLFLATATSWNVECTKVAFEWLASAIDTFTEPEDISNIALDLYRLDEKKEYVEFTKTLLRQADINISKFNVEARRINQNIDDMQFGGIMINGQLIPPFAGEHYEFKITTGHCVRNDDGSEKEYLLDLQEESLGTKQLFLMGPILKKAFDQGKTLVIDEIEKSLHPCIVRFLFSLFHNPKINQKGAQLIATTHETTLLTLELFRRDQIYFTEKDMNTGITDVYSLDEFPVRKTDNIEKGYLMGRYGAIPFMCTEGVF